MLKKIVFPFLAVLTASACLANATPAAGITGDENPLKKLTPPATVTGGPITGLGKDRKAELQVKSESDRGIQGYGS